MIASSGNRTRAARVAGEHSTTEPTMLPYNLSYFKILKYASENLLDSGFWGFICNEL